MVSPAAIEAIEKHIGAKLPAALIERYRKSDGSKAAGGAYRLMKLAEVRAVPFREAYLANAPEKQFLTKHGIVVWPFWTNDNSDHLALFLTGPLAGRISFAFHDEPGLFLAYRDIRSLERAMKAARPRDGEDWITTEDLAVDYGPDRSTPTAAHAAADREVARKLRALGNDAERALASTLERLVPPATTTKAKTKTKAKAKASPAPPLAAPSGSERWQPEHVDAIDVQADLRAFGSTRDRDGMTLLSIAAARGRLDVVDRLLAAGVGVDDTKTGMFTPLMHAALAGHVAVVERLLAAGADRAYSIEGSTAQTWAEYGNHDAVVKLLRANRAKTPRRRT